MFIAPKRYVHGRPSRVVNLSAPLCAGPLHVDDPGAFPHHLSTADLMLLSHATCFFTVLVMFNTGFVNVTGPKMNQEMNLWLGL